ncbi:hypothetical protein SAMN05661080_00028 [Modestobacter sp. DSM 44400]|nr:hypothetical protein SAMN05661080_00028 [Modestobacter sp. DSM 44400]
MSSNEGDAAERRRLRAEGLLGGAAEPVRSRPGRVRPQAPGAVRRAALVVAVEAAALGAVGLWLLVLTVTGNPDSVGRALATVVYVGLAAALLGGASVGLWRVSGWARGPVVVLQLLLAVIGYSLAFQAERPLLGVPVLALVALEFYLLATPEARLAFMEREPDR